jgi:hypothetical protein
MVKEMYSRNSLPVWIIFLFLLIGCDLLGWTSYRISSARADYAEVKRIWEYCKKCLAGEDCAPRARAQCEASNTLEEIKYTMGTALGRGNFDTVRYLVEVVGLDVNIPLDSNQSTALHNCSYFGGPQDDKICRYLVSKGANVNATALPNARTPLLLSIQKHNNRNAIFLLSNGADTSITSHSGSDACEFAYQYANLEIMHYLDGCCKRYSMYCVNVQKPE